MKTKNLFGILTLFLFTFILLTACEKETHDGIDYFKSKCMAELNGL